MSSVVLSATVSAHFDRHRSERARWWPPVPLVCALAGCLALLVFTNGLATRPPAAASAAALLGGSHGAAFFAYPASVFPAPVADTSDRTPVGTLNGRVTYEGTPKKLKPIDMSAEPKCAKFYDAPPLPDAGATGNDNSLQNVIVYVSAGAPDENFTGPVVHLNQRGCRYTPHIVAVQTNQEVWVQNDDSVTHSVHPMPQHNAEWNRSQPPGTPPVVIRYGQPEFIKVKCEFHPWMRGVMAVFKNSHHAVTDSTGAFTLAELPPGKYTITAWHEIYGAQSKEITIAPGQSADLNFVFKVTQ